MDLVVEHVKFLLGTMSFDYFDVTVYQLRFSTLVGKCNPMFGTVNASYHTLLVILLKVQIRISWAQSSQVIQSYGSPFQRMV
jgi:hypothetical protein